MDTEIEAKFLDIDREAVRTTLRKLGATCEQPERLMRARNFDFADNRLEAIGGWIRVRDEGDRTTLSYKQLNDRTLHGTKEVQMVIDSFDAAVIFLESLGFKQKVEEHKKRESWRLGDAQIELDEWPWIKSFIEIEGPSEAVVRETATQLGFEWDNAVFGSVEAVYQSEYDVTEQEVNSWPQVAFIPVPDWLQAKRKAAK